MTGGKNVLKYITTEGKRTGKKTALEYFQKSTGVFNGNGMLSSDEVEEMKSRLKNNSGNIWHGFISLSEEDSQKIDTVEKCTSMIKQTFGAFLTDCKLNEKNIDLMCALHLDKPHHLHMHFVFWEKEPKYKGRDRSLCYRAKGKIDKYAIDNMFVRLGLYVDNDKSDMHKTRDNAIRELREMTFIKKAMNASEEIKMEVISLAKDLPKTGRLSYGSSNMESYRGRVDKIVQMLLNNDGQARKVDNQFYEALQDRKEKIQNICGNPYVFSTKNISEETMARNLPKYHNAIDLENIKIIEKIEADYKKRQGNLVISLCRAIKPEIYERKQGKRYKTNDNRLKKNLSMSNKKISTLWGKFLSSFFDDSKLLERDYTNRLKDIEEEVKKEREQNNRNKEDNGKY